MIPREKIVAAVGTTIFAILLILLLLFSYFTIATPPDELEGIPVMFGTMDDASGMFEPAWEENPATPTPELTPNQPQFDSQEPLIAQTDEPSIDIREEKRQERERQAKEQAERRRAEAEAEQRRQEEARRREIEQNVSGLFGEAGGSRGETEGQGTQGSSTGNSPTGAKSGIGGIGSYNLGGRSLGRGGLIQPKYSVNDYGKIVVNITVDPAGNVIHAEIGRGTDTPNPTLRNEALRAARATKFNAVSSANNQTGTITYNFNLR